MIFITLLFSISMPLLFPLCLGYMTLMYWYSKFMMFKFCQKTQVFNEHLVISGYALNKLAIIIHLIMTYKVLQASDVLHTSVFSKVNFDNKVLDLTELSIDNYTGYPLSLQILIAFSIILACLYGFNLFFFNPISFLFKCCHRVNSRLGASKQSKNLQNKRIQKYLQGEGEMSQTIDLPENITSFSVHTTFSKAAAPITPSKQEVMQFKFQELKHSERFYNKALVSHNFYNEVTFD